MAIKFFRKCGISIPMLALALALSSISGCIDVGMKSLQASSSHDDAGTQAGIQENSSISLDLSFESEIDGALFRTWGKAILWSKRPMPYLLLNATLLQDGTAVGQARYLLMDVEPLKDYSFEISRIEKADLDEASYSCLLEATGPDGIIASETRQCRFKYYPPEPSSSPSGLVRTPEEEWPDYEPLQYMKSDQSGSKDDGSGSDNDEVNEPWDNQVRTGPETDMGAEDGESYVGSKSSKKYHMADCRYALKLAGSKNKITFNSIEDAESQGYEPCKVCNPAG